MRKLVTPLVLVALTACSEVDAVPHTPMLSEVSMDADAELSGMTLFACPGWGTPIHPSHRFCFCPGTPNSPFRQRSQMSYVRW